MSKNPIYNALAASGYIIVIVFTINFMSGFEENTGLGQYMMPIMVLSLLTLSVAVMGYIFFLQPLRMYLDGKKEEAVKLFVKTIGAFAAITFLIVLIYSLVGAK